ncbi:MAG: molybdopterin converting factor subunit 1 [Thalassobaculales bacterium]
MTAETRAPITLLWFAWLRQRVGVGEEKLVLPAEIATVADLLAWLPGRGPGHAAALAEPGVVKVAVNQVHVGADHPLRPGDEVALFPPVTGG